MQQTSTASKFANNRWATKAQRQQRHSIDLNEAFAEQWAETYS
jgi:hypothetical protein